MRPGATSCPAGSTGTPTWRCPSAGRRRRTRSRPAPARPRGAARPRSSTSRSSRSASSLQDGLAAWHAKADGNCAIDYAFHLIIGDVNDDSLKEMDALVDEGVTSFKLFMAYPGVLLLRRRPDPAGHAEGRGERRADHDARRERHRHRRARRTGAGPRRDRPALPRHRRATSSPRTRRPTGRSCWPTSPDAPALRRARVGQAGAGGVAEARDKGQNVFGETCPQYLYLSYDDLGGAGLRGRQVRLLHPAAARASTRTRCGAGCARTTCQVVSTDHCPFCFKDQKEMGIGDFSQDPERDAGRRAPDGPALPGRGRRADLAAPLDRAGCATPARMFGLYPRKGVIAPGCRRRRRRLRPGRAHGRCRRRPTT